MLFQRCGAFAGVSPVLQVSATTQYRCDPRKLGDTDDRGRRGRAHLSQHGNPSAPHTLFPLLGLTVCAWWHTQRHLITMLAVITTCVYVDPTSGIIVGILISLVNGAFEESKACVLCKLRQGDSVVARFDCDLVPAAAWHSCSTRPASAASPLCSFAPPVSLHYRRLTCGARIDRAVAGFRGSRSGVDLSQDFRAPLDRKACIHLR
jgi:hypothetical protein